MQFHSEGGLELLSRFSEKPSVIDLDEILFPNGISTESIVEITGASSTGKTLLLCQLLARCVLPARYKEIKLGGCDACAILIDTLGHIRIGKIAQLMTSMVRSAYRVAGVQQPPVETVTSIVSKSLENLSVIGCCNHHQFQLALHTLEDEFLGNERISLLAIDNILAYYWRERQEKGIVSMNSYVKSLIQIIRAHTSNFRTMTVYTRLDEPNPENNAHPKRVSLSDRSDVNYRLQLRKSNACNFVCRAESTNDIKQICYTICNSGVKWIL